MKPMRILGALLMVAGFVLPYPICHNIKGPLAEVIDSCILLPLFVIGAIVYLSND
jgi:hypothetical protein